MKIHAEFWHKSAISDELIPACGDRSVIVLDGRSGMWKHHAIARIECTCRGYLGYRLMRGPSFTRSVPITPLVKLSGDGS